MKQSNDCDTCVAANMEDVDICRKCTTKVISSKEYATEIENRIEDELEDALFGLLYILGKKFRLTELCSISDFQDIYCDHAADLREIVIEIFEECGMNVKSDGRSF